MIKQDFKCDHCGKDFVLGHWILQYIYEDKDFKQRYFIHKFCEEPFLKYFEVNKKVKGAD